MSRKLYIPDSPAEAFIVPLLREEIESFIRSFDNEQLSFLDVGCGSQPFRKMIEERHSYRGLDYKAQVTDGSVIEVGIDDQNIEALIEKESYDVILCTEVLEHVYDLFSAFANLEKMLKKGGKLLVTTPFFYPLHEEPQDFWRLTPYALERLGTTVGFQVVRQNKLGSAMEVGGTALGTINYIEYQSGNGKYKNRLVNRLKDFLFGWIANSGLTYWKAYSNLYLANLFIYTK